MYFCLSRPRVSWLMMSTVIAENHRHSSVTGFFGLDEDGIPVVDRHGIMLVFDGDIAGETVSVDTFEVSLNDGSLAEVVETRVDGAYVFLKLADELVSDAMPIVGIAPGMEVEDLAGNSTNRQKLGFVKIKDGISPRLTVTLSDGSGLGTGDEGPDRLTNDSIDIRIESDEPLQGAPRVMVVCKDIAWTEIVDGREIERDIDDLMGNRNGAFASVPREPQGTVYTCGNDVDRDGVDDVFRLTEDIANSRPGEVWEYTWRNPTGPDTSLRDGQLAVVAFGRDRSRYDRFGEDVSNWSVASGGFRLDTEFEGAAVPDGIVVYPEDGSKISEFRPFVLIEFNELSTVTLISMLFDGMEVSDELQILGDNEFVFWPLSMNSGQHTVAVEARDSAGNNFGFDFSFESVKRTEYVLELHSGWNAVSFPASPVDTSIDAVFTDPSVEAVIGWDGDRWSMATRRNGIWRSVREYEPLVGVQRGSGYWVKSSGFVHQPVRLASTVPDPVFEPMDGEYRPPATGWVFLGVVDRYHAEDHFGETLVQGKGEPVTAREYLGDYEVAYTWDPIEQRFEPLLPGATMTIGDGVWVYYKPTVP